MTAPLAAAAPKPRVAAPPEPLLADDQGSISHLLLHFADYDIIPTLYTLLRARPAAMRISIVSPGGERRRLLDTLIKEWPLPDRRGIQLIDLRESMDFWIRDEFVVGTGNRIILPQRYNIHEMPATLRELSRRAALKPIHSLIEFDGGNVVPSEKHVFVGSNLIAKNTGDLFGSETELHEYLRQLFGKTPVSVGTRAAPTPHEHIDMLLTPLGGGRILLGDPRLAVELLRKQPKLLEATYGKVYFNENVTPLPPAAKKLLFGTQDFIARLQADVGVAATKGATRGDLYKDNDIALALLYAKNGLPRNLKAFDDLEADLRRKGFTDIHRVPVLMNHDIENGPFITYNNMLLESRDGKRIAYLPAYNIKPLDEAAQATMRKLGFTVVPIDVQNISFYNGTLRCITQVLERK